jgi:hypothetical protein
MDVFILIDLLAGGNAQITRQTAKWLLKLNYPKWTKNEIGNDLHAFSGHIFLHLFSPGSHLYRYTTSSTSVGNYFWWTPTGNYSTVQAITELALPNSNQAINMWTATANNWTLGLAGKATGQFGQTGGGEQYGMLQTNYISVSPNPITPPTGNPLGNGGGQWPPIGDEVACVMAT